MNEGLNYLIQIDPQLREIVLKFGAPPFWSRPEGFPSLLKIILEQQVSLASAQSAYDKLIKTIEVLTPERFLRLTDEDLKRIGFSRQKIRYCKHLAKSIFEKQISLEDLNSMSDEKVHETLTLLPGIGPWTSGIYILMALKRADVWPKGDLALLKALKEVKSLEEIPDNEKASNIALAWKPWRAVAARILWHYYLSTR
jgi:DNA-3-methyladenine glycosylase II